LTSLLKYLWFWQITLALSIKPQKLLSHCFFFVFLSSTCICSLLYTSWTHHVCCPEIGSSPIYWPIGRHPVVVHIQYVYLISWYHCSFIITTCFGPYWTIFRWCLYIKTMKNHTYSAYIPCLWLPKWTS
jgi:hypothetical protein